MAITPVKRPLLGFRPGEAADNRLELFFADELDVSIRREPYDVRPVLLPPAASAMPPD